jgi:hypothetical protein
VGEYSWNNLTCRFDFHLTDFFLRGTSFFALRSKSLISSLAGDWGVNVPRKAVAELGVSWQADRLGLPRWVEGFTKPLDLAIFIARALA